MYIAHKYIAHKMISQSITATLAEVIMGSLLMERDFCECT